MCLLITQDKNSPRLSEEWLTDFYSYNSDGVGVMYAEQNTLVVEKILPRCADDFVRFYADRIHGRKCAFHLRMRTHGDTDLENCHPYEVLNKREHGSDLWLMHNGILASGNGKDTNKSDTWHYIREYLRPMLAANADYAFTEAFADIVGAHIGSSNKFVLMDDKGRQAVVNKSSGVYWAGVWLSNTYAWTKPDDVSKKPTKNKKKAAEQANTVPELRGLYTVSSGYEYMYDAYDAFSWRDELYAEGYFRAADVGASKVSAFGDMYGDEAIWWLTDALMYQEIEEDHFMACLNNPSSAVNIMGIEPVQRFFDTVQ